MANAPIGIAFVADVSDVVKGSQQMENSLDDVGTALDELGQDAAKASRTSQRAFASLEKEGDQTADHLERSFKQTFDDLPKQAKKGADKASRAVDDLGDEVGAKGKGKFAELGQDVGSEFSANIGEGIGSGSSDLVGTVLGTLGGILPGLGALGAVAGIGALVMSSIVGGISASAEAQKQKVKDIGASLFDALQDGIVDRQEATDIVTQALGADNWTDALGKLRDQAKETGVPVASLFQAYKDGSGNAEHQLQGVIDAHSHLENIAATGIPVIVTRYDAVGQAAQNVKDQLQASAAAADLANQNLSTQASIFGTLTKEAQAYGRAVAGAQNAALQTRGIVGGRKLEP